MAPPLVSIGLPVYNGERYLESAIRTLLGQTFADIELVICDNASTDRTDEICRDVTAGDSRVRYSRNPRNIGIAANHNRTFELSRGRYFKWAAHDDEYLPAFVARCVEAFDSAPAAASLVYTHCEIVNELGASIGFESDTVGCSNSLAPARLRRYMTNLRSYNVTYGLIRADALRRTPLFGLYPMSDTVLFAELAMQGPIVELPEPLLRRRVHPGNSLEQHKSAQARRELFDPSLAGKRAWMSPDARVRLELAAATLRAPVSFVQRTGCLAVAMVTPPEMALRKQVGLLRRRLIAGMRRS